MLKAIAKRRGISVVELIRTYIAWGLMRTTARATPAIFEKCRRKDVMKDSLIAAREGKLNDVSQR